MHALLRKLNKGKEAEAPGSASAASDNSKPLFPDGIKQLYPADGESMDDAEVDICFVHGLTGDRENTWTAKNQSAPWPQTLLPPIFPKARILTFGYDAYVVQSSVASSNGLDNHARNLLHDLVGDRQDCHAKGRPLIFVAHSLGGIVCKQAVSFSRSSKFEHLHDIYDSVIGIAFMGTPHRGSSLANWATIPVSVLGVLKSTNAKLTDVLRVGDPLLVRTYNEFLEALAERQKCGTNIHVVCFFEELPIVRDLKVVTEHSATMDGDIAISIHANHSDMVRFASKDSNGFVRLRRELDRWMEDNRTKTKSKADAVDVPREDSLVNDPINARCIQDLLLSDPDDDRTRIEKKNGSFFEHIHDWIFSNDIYKQWRDGDPQSRLLWIRGDPGKGKTMILCSIIRNLNASGTTLSFFFCQATNEQLNHATAVLRGLIYILVKRQPALIGHVRKKYDLAGNKRLFDGENAWEALSKIFTDMVNDELLSDVVVLVDGLDECTAGRARLLDLIARPSHVRWLVSSRNWPDIQEGLRGAEQKAELRLELSPDAISKAVDVYIRLKVDQLAIKKGYDHATKSAVEQHLLANADGTFLWVALVCHALDGVGVYRWNVRDKLMSFPRGLLALYGRMVQTIEDANNADHCRAILAVASTVYRPITLAELPILCPSLAGLSREDLEIMIQLCGSFLTLRDDALYFVHQSAKDYLVGEALPKIMPHGLGSQHHTIASRSLAAMSSVLKRDMYGLQHPGYAIEDVVPPTDDPLAPVAYSCLFWIDHLAEADTSQRSASLQDSNEVHIFFLEKSLYWLEALSLLKSIWAGVVAVRKLDAMVNRKKQDLTGLVHDMSRFILSWAHVIAVAPLQTYASALLFSPRNSQVRWEFAADMPDWVIMKPETSDNWNACIQTLEGPSHMMSSVAFSPDGSRLASSYWFSTGPVKIWDVLSGQCLHTFGLEGRPCYRIVFSPNGQKLAVLSLPTIFIYDLTGQLLHSLEAGEDDVLVSFSFSPDGLKLASAKNPAIDIWDVLSGQRMRTLRGHDGCVKSIAFSPDGEKLASGSSDASIVIWDRSGKPLHTLTSKDGSAIELVVFFWSPQGLRLASYSADDMVRVWDILSGQCMRTLQFPNSSSATAAFSPDGQKLAVGSWDGMIKVWDLAEQGLQTEDPGTPMHVFRHTHGSSAVCTAFSPDGQKLASGSTAVKIWDLAAQPTSTQFTFRKRLMAANGFHSAKRGAATTDQIIRTLSDEQARSFVAQNRLQNRLQKKSTHRCFDMINKNSWIAVHGRRLLWLPLEYRPKNREEWASQKRLMVIADVERVSVSVLNFAPKFGIC